MLRYILIYSGYASVSNKLNPCLITMTSARQLIMVIIEGPNKPTRMQDSTKYRKDMEQLMGISPNIKRTRTEALRYS